MVLELTPFLVRSSCDLSGFFKLGSEVARRQVFKRRMRPVSIVVVPPCGDALARIRHRQEPGSVEALLPEPAVERLDECVVRGLSWS